MKTNLCPAQRTDTPPGPSRAPAGKRHSCGLQLLETSCGQGIAKAEYQGKLSQSCNQLTQTNTEKQMADLSVEVCQMDLQMAESVGTAGGNQQHSAGAEVELWRGVRASQEVVCPKLLHTF